MGIDDMFYRANLSSLAKFLIQGDESNEEAPYRRYSERLMEADHRAAEFLRDRFPVLKEYDEIMAYYYDQTEVIQDVYFEIGLILGAKIALEISKRMEELK